MKKILIFSHAMEIGGAERALLGLLEAMDYTQYSVDLFLMRHTGELLKYIPEEVKLLPEIPQYASLAVPISQVARKRQYKVLAGRVIGKLKAIKREKQLGVEVDGSIQLEYSHKYTCFAMPELAEKYDLAISFLTPHYFVANKVTAKTKIAWIHTDYTKVNIDVKSERKMWKKYDHIISISDAVTQSFLVKFPELENKIEVIKNIMPSKCIQEQVRENCVEKEIPNDGSIKLLSIGRFCYAKNFDNIPQICGLIRKNGLNVKWYLVGYGGDEGLIRQKIKEYHMEEFVVVLGKKENPYPYIATCDFYVQPSRYEGNSVSVREAQLLNKPVVITDYATAKSQLENGVDGLIVPMDNEKCAELLSRILLDEKKAQLLKENMRKRDYSNVSEVNKLYDVLVD